MQNKKIEKAMKSFYILIANRFNFTINSKEHNCVHKPIAGLEWSTNTKHGLLEIELPKQKDTRKKREQANTVEQQRRLQSNERTPQQTAETNITEEQNTTRRGFMKALGWLGGMAAVGTAGYIGVKMMSSNKIEKTEAAKDMETLDMSQFSISGSRATYPNKDSGYRFKLFHEAAPNGEWMPLNASGSWKNLRGNIYPLEDGEIKWQAFALTTDTPLTNKFNNENN